ncbi:hypothetical protein C884_01424 [Kocuria palustris PEL]|uniref:Uncharacterized protein n=1 Tax=Kocuria palustris PEL TaxID=1236550 RepID=M2WB39_9MICC|nr:hypothetical protein C884_01424 [Kocuria palustris PEL]
MRGRRGLTGSTAVSDATGVTFQVWSDHTILTRLYMMRITSRSRQEKSIREGP